MIQHKLKRNITLLLLFCGLASTLFAQQLIKGVVLDEKGVPLIGAVVSVKNTQKETNTDLKVEEGFLKLDFSRLAIEIKAEFTFVNEHFID